MRHKCLCEVSIGVLVPFSKDWISTLQFVTVFYIYYCYVFMTFWKDRM
nr:MAG TPA: hypothetical protein [Caudoviricetes sp.]